MNDNSKSSKFDNRKKIRITQIALTYSSSPYSEPDIASGFSCLSHPCASNRALWLHTGVHGESTGLSRPC